MSYNQENENTLDRNYDCRSAFTHFHEYEYNVV